MAATHCFEILVGNSATEQLPAVVVLAGDDAFLRRETGVRLLHRAGIDIEEAKVFDGEECKWIDVHDELATLSLFATDSRRVAIVTSADKLVKDARPHLERWCEHAASGSLVMLQVETFPSNTKLYKLADKHGWCIQCALPTGGGRSKTPSVPELKKWLLAWAKQEHALKVAADQATLIIDAVGMDCGLIHQELAKLALYADGPNGLTDDLVRQHVGSWRTRTTWEIADAIADGRIADALEQLQKVFAAGEHPAAVVPQVAWSLRRFGNAAQLVMQSHRTGAPMSVKAAVGQCGFWGRDAQLAEERLKKLGLRRAAKILDWLLELDLKIKGSHSHEDRAIFALEEFCLRFARAS